MANIHMKKFSTSLPIQEMQIKTALDSISPQAEWLSQGNNKWGLGYRKRNTYTLLVGM
jgi:hypothetical protein